MGNLVTVPYFFDLSLGIRYVVDLTECGVYKVAFYINGKLTKSHPFDGSMTVAPVYSSPASAL